MPVEAIRPVGTTETEGIIEDARVKRVRWVMRVPATRVAARVEAFEQLRIISANLEGIGSNQVKRQGVKLVFSPHKMTDLRSTLSKMIMLENAKKTKHNMLNPL